MKSNFIYPTLSAIVAGIVIAAAGFYWFTPRQVDLLEGLSIESRQVDVSSLLLTEVVSAATSNLTADKSTIVKNFAEALGYRNSFSIVDYQIRNSSKKSIERIQVIMNSPISGYVSSESGKEIISKGTKTISLNMLPESTSNVTLLLDYVGYLSTERFMVNGISVPISKIESPRSSKSYLPEFYLEYPITIYVFSCLGLMAMALLILQIVQALYVGKRPDRIIKTTDLSNLATAVALVNWARSDDPDVYKAVVRRAEKIHEIWSSSDDSKE